MMIQPKIRGFICTTAHPTGCHHMVHDQINFVLSKEKIVKGPKNVLVIGASTGYGLASRIVATFGANAKTIGVFYERAADEKRTATPGWYNTAAFETIAKEQGLFAKSINGDAFSDDIKVKVANMIRDDFGTVDLIIYSLASPRRIHPDTGEIYQSVLKPIHETFQGKTIDAFKKEVKEVVIEPATETEIENTIQVMGGDDWQRWINFLYDEKLLAEGIKTIAYSYLGPQVTHAIYKEGTIGMAKMDLKKACMRITQKLKLLQGEAIISVDKAVVTQASAAIPVVPLYISILFKVMKEKGLHEGCIEQMYRLFSEYLYGPKLNERDSEGYIRMDDKEMREDVQESIVSLWPEINSDNLSLLADVDGYCTEFYRLFGFKVETVDYAEAVDPVVFIPSIKS